MVRLVVVIRGTFLSISWPRILVAMFGMMVCWMFDMVHNVFRVVTRVIGVVCGMIVLLLCHYVL